MKSVVTPYVLFLSMKTHKGIPEVLASHPPKGIIQHLSPRGGWFSCLSHGHVRQGHTSLLA